MSETARDRVAEQNKILDDWEKDLGLPPNKAPGTEVELQSYLNLDREALEKMSSDRAIGISYRLSLYSLYFSRCINRNKAVKTWADKELRDMIANSANQYDKYTKYEVVVGLICRENPAAKEMSNVITFAMQRMNRLEDISGGIRNLSYVISLVLKSRLGDRNG